MLPLVACLALNAPSAELPPAPAPHREPLPDKRPLTAKERKQRRVGNILLGTSAASLSLGAVSLSLASSYDVYRASNDRANSPLTSLGISLNLAAIPLAAMGGVHHGRVLPSGSTDHLRRRARVFLAAGGVTLGVGVIGLSVAAAYTAVDSALDGDVEYEDENGNITYGSSQNISATLIPGFVAISVGSGLLGYGGSLRRNSKRRLTWRMSPQLAPTFAGVSVGGRF